MVRTSLKYLPDYQYTPLDPDLDDEIRLLHLDPGSGDDPISFSLRPARLSEKPDYEAISYTWGDPTITRHVICEGQKLPITVNLFAGLGRLRRPDSVRVLWADAVCINQKDIPERNKQILLMSDIFTHTRRVLIWLGESTPEMAGLEECLQTAKELLPPEVIDWEELYRVSQTIGSKLEKLRREGRPNFADMNWKPYIALMNKPWFGRRWIIQEVALADNNVPRLAICGAIKFAWEDLASVAYRLGSSSVLVPMCGLSAIHRPSPDIASFLSNDAESTIMITNTFMVYLSRYFRTKTLVDGVIATAQFRCADARDHLYSLMSLFPIPPGLEPDYTISFEDMCLRFATTMLVSEQNLKTLTLAPDTFVAHNPGKPVPERKDLPSWVPDLSRQGLIQPLVSYTIRPQLFHAGGTAPPDVPVSTDPTGRILRLRGRIVDAVALLGTPLIFFPIPKEEELAGWHDIHGVLTRRSMNWIAECRRVAMSLPSPTPLADLDAAWAATDDRFRRDFYTTLVCGMTGMRDPLPEEMLGMAETYCQHLWSMFTVPGYQASAETLEVLHTYGMLFEGTLQNVSVTRAFCRTAEGRLAQARPTAQTGDVFCVVLGAEVPYLLRPSSEKPGVYKLVGDAYLHGVMQGEALKDSRYETVNILIE